MNNIPKLDFDSELEAVLVALKDILPGTITPEMIPALQNQTSMEGVPGPDEILAEFGLERRDLTIPGYEGAEIGISVVQKPGHIGLGPGIYHTHGGGMISGDRWTGMREVSSWVNEFDAVAVTVEYRLAPGHPDPYPVEDCYAGLVWTAEHARELGIDPAQLLIAGSSAGGGLAAGTALVARDRSGPPLIGQMLIYAMIDDRLDIISNLQVDGIGIWDRVSNRTGWTALVGARRATDEVSIYAAPSRATDLSGLPSTFMDCGSVEVFRDEDVAYASLLWASGVQTELHVWPGGFHGIEQIAPQLYGVAEIQVAGIASPATFIPFGGGLLALAAFLVVQLRSRSPLIPARVISGWRKATALAAIGASSIGMTGAMLLLTYHVQDVMGAAPAVTGLMLLPLPLSIVAASLGFGSTLLGRFDPYVLLVPGTLAGILGGLLLVGISPESSYPLQLLPAMLLIGGSLGVVGVASLTVMLGGTSSADAGVASAVQQSSQQVSAALGLAVFNAIAAAVTASVASSGALPKWALAAGLGAAAWTLVAVSEAVLSLVIAVLVRSVRRRTVRLAVAAPDVRSDAAAVATSEGV